MNFYRRHLLFRINLSPVLAFLQNSNPYTADISDMCTPAEDVFEETYRSGEGGLDANAGCSMQSVPDFIRSENKM